MVKTRITIVSYFGNMTASLFALTIVRKFGLLTMVKTGITIVSYFGNMTASL